LYTTTVLPKLQRQKITIFSLLIIYAIDISNLTLAPPLPVYTLAHNSKLKILFTCLLFLYYGTISKILSLAFISGMSDSTLKHLLSYSFYPGSAPFLALHWCCLTLSIYSQGNNS
jgi:hypothetical protein